MELDSASTQNFLLVVEISEIAYHHWALKLEHSDGTMIPPHEQLLTQSVAKKHLATLPVQPYRSLVQTQKGNLAHHHGHRVQHL
jgi:hypothetical protein